MPDRERDRDRDRDSEKGGYKRKESPRDRRDDPRNDGYTAMKHGDRRREYEDLQHEISDDRRSFERDRDRRGRDNRDNRDGRDGRTASKPRRSPREGDYSLEEMQPVLASAEDIGIVVPGRSPPVSPASAQSRDASRYSQRMNNSRDTNEISLATQYAQYAGFEVENWLQLAETGKLDIYTCLGLSGGTALKKGRWKLIRRTAAALFIQMTVPILLLHCELDKIPEGDRLSLQPVTSEVKLRVIGSTMILFSLFALHGNCLDMCRSSMLQFVLEQRLPWVICWPILLGELSKLIVGPIMVLTMTICFNDALDGASLVLYAVAFNFLAGIDAVFVDRETHLDAMQGFREIMVACRYALAKDKYRCWSRTVDVGTSVLRTCFVLVGIILALGFGILPTRHDQSNLWMLPFKLNSSVPLIL